MPSSPPIWPETDYSIIGFYAPNFKNQDQRKREDQLCTETSTQVEEATNLSPIARPPLWDWAGGLSAAKGRHRAGAFAGHEQEW